MIQEKEFHTLAQAGVLGGRTFDVLMTSLLLKILQERLDFAHALHPLSITLGPIIASKTYELENIESISSVEAGNIEMLRSEIKSKGGF